MVPRKVQREQPAKGVTHQRHPLQRQHLQRRCQPPCNACHPLGNGRGGGAAVAGLIQRDDTETILPVMQRPLPYHAAVSPPVQEDERGIAAANLPEGDLCPIYGSCFKRENCRGCCFALIHLGSGGIHLGYHVRAICTYLHKALLICIFLKKCG